MGRTKLFAILLAILLPVLGLASGESIGCSLALHEELLRLSTRYYKNVSDALNELPKDPKAWTNAMKNRWKILESRLEAALTREEGEIIEREITELEREIARVGKARIDAAAALAAREQDVVVITYPQEPKAYLQLGKSWESNLPKPMAVKAKTADSGLARGFVPADQALSKAVREPGGVEKYNSIVKEILEEQHAIAVPLMKHGRTAVIREGRELWVWRALPTDKVIKVLADLEGRYFVSDLDVVAVGSKKIAPVIKFIHRISIEQSFGAIREEDLVNMKKINAKFHRLDGYNSENHPQVRNIIQHGSGNLYFHGPKLNSWNFPMTAYLPDGRIEEIAEEQQLKNLFQQYKELGYGLIPNPAWGW
jgi:hypothetical protein